MTRIAGSFFDGESSSSTEGVLIFYRDGHVALSAQQIKREVQFSDLRFSDRVGNIPRNIYFPDSAKFETTDNDAVDELLRTRSQGLSARLQHTLESKLKYIALALVVVMSSTYGLVRYGIPAMARTAAYALPASTSTQIGTGTLSIMDKSVFDKTSLSKKRQRTLRKTFSAMLPKDDPGVDYRLEFRSSNRLGANAFALPSGIVIMTDDMVALAKNDAELVTVLAHEIGHIHNRHSMRRLIQGSIVAFITVMVTGDVSTTSTLLAALPTLFIEAQYSQAFETEADNYSLKYMLDNRVAPIHFVNIMQRLENSRPSPPNKTGKKQGLDDDSEISDFFSSHPPTKKRLNIFREAQRRFVGKSIN